MIDQITTTGRWIEGTINRGTTPYPTGQHINDGEVRFVGVGNTGFEICVDGRWQRWHGDSATINLSSQAEAILVWAESKMMEERRIKELAQTNPTVADAVGALKKAEEQLRVVMTLSQTVSPV